MDAQRLTYLYDRYQAGQLSSEELAEWQGAVMDISNDAQLLDLTEEAWGLNDSVAPAAGSEVAERIYGAVVGVRDVPVAHSNRRLWPRIAVAAAAVAAITLGTWIYVNEIASSRNASRNDEVVMNDVKPGSVGATLTLANGQTIKLSDATNGELAKEAGVTITKSEDGQLIYEIASVPRNDDTAPSLRDEVKQSHTSNTLSTAKGETYQVRLPDGTAVWLNAASRLTYAATLNQQGQRRVSLEGEAYFQVAKDKSHPFIVESKGQQVEVLGTHFNINAYADEDGTKTTLLEGSVKVSPLDPSILRHDGKMPESTILKPNQQSVLSEKGGIQVKQVDARQQIAWKNGLFTFKNTPLPEVMRQLSRWYDLTIVYENESAKQQTFGGSISRYDQVSGILNAISMAGKVKFSIEGKKIIVQ